MVRLRLLGQGEDSHIEDSFNPTMVRLRPGLADSGSFRSLPFQSHYGAIATRSHGLQGGVV